MYHKKKPSDPASLHNGIKAKQQEARLCPSYLADPSDVQAPAINLTVWNDKRAQVSGWLK